MADAEPQVTVGLEDLAQYLSEASRENWHLIDTPIAILFNEYSMNLNRLHAIRRDAEEKARGMSSFHSELEEQNILLAAGFHDGELAEHKAHQQSFMGTLHKIAGKVNPVPDKLRNLAARVDKVEMGLRKEDYREAKANMLNQSMKANDDEDLRCRDKITE
ncbi:MAG: hypothetical protein Q9169_007575 [Polycauliona sp. 2 TL-2023]